EAPLGSGALAQWLPLVQPAALGRPTRRAVKEQDWDFDDLRKACADASGSELPKLARLRRGWLQGVGMGGLTGLVAYAMVSAVADVGLANLADEFKAADLGWLAAATLLSPIYPVAQTGARGGAGFRRLRVRAL